MNLNKITPAKVDEVLNYLLTHLSIDATNQMETAIACQALGLTLDELRDIFAILQGDKLVADLNDRGSVFLFLLMPEAWDMMQRGGYTAEVLHLLSK